MQRMPSATAGDAAPPRRRRPAGDTNFPKYGGPRRGAAPTSLARGVTYALVGEYQTRQKTTPARDTAHPSSRGIRIRGGAIKSGGGATWVPLSEREMRPRGRFDRHSLPGGGRGARPSPVGPRVGESLAFTRVSAARERSGRGRSGCCPRSRLPDESEWANPYPHGACGGGEVRRRGSCSPMACGTPAANAPTREAGLGPGASRSAHLGPASPARRRHLGSAVAVDHT